MLKKVIDWLKDSLFIEETNVWLRKRDEQRDGYIALAKREREFKEIHEDLVKVQTFRDNSTKITHIEIDINDCLMALLYDSQTAYPTKFMVYLSAEIIKQTGDKNVR